MEPAVKIKEDELLQQAIDRFTATTGIYVGVVAHDHPVGGGKHFDALADIGKTTDAKTYAIEIRRHLTTAKLGLAAEHLKGAPYKGMLVTDYVNPNMADRLKEMDLAFIDLAGNAYLNEPPIFVYIRGNRPTDKKALGRNLKPTHAFQATGLRILFGLLAKPDLLNATYREIADVTGVALGTVGGVFTDLREHGFLYEGKGRRRQLTQKRKIIEQWVTEYPNKLRPKLTIGRYHAPTHLWWDNVRLEPYNAQWGGEIAAAKLTDYLIPQKTTIYADAIPPGLLAGNQLKVDPEGDVEILRRFWDPFLFEKNTAYINYPIDIVPPLLIYADLMATADDRNIETAKIVYDKYLNGYFE